MSDQTHSFTWKDGQLWHQKDSSKEPEKAIPIFARPISAWGEGISILSDKDKTEIFWANTINDVPESSRGAIEKALEVRYGFFEVTRILKSDVNFGHRVIEVETLQGHRSLNVTSAWKNVLVQENGSVIIRDSVGNRFRISDISTLDPHSQVLFKKSF